MILAELRDYLAEHKRVALRDVVYRFNADPEALRDMLAILERKGWVRQLPLGTCCSDGCNQCDPVSVELFEWIEPKGR